MPFLELASIHTAGSHFSNPIGLSSKIVPSFTENCRPQSRHFQIRRVLTEGGVCPFPPAQANPLGPAGRGEERGGAVPFGDKGDGVCEGFREGRGLCGWEENAAQR